MDKKISWKRILVVIIIAIGFIGIWLIQFHIDIEKQKKITEKFVGELMYFPSGRFLKPTFIEYQSIASDLIWLRAIQYYGQHLITDNKYEWLEHIFDILTTLDRKFIGAYDFGSQIIAWDAGRAYEALKLLHQGIAYNPLNWRLVFNAGFINYMLTKDYVTAGYYFEIASKLPETWKITERWAAFSYKKGGAKEMAIEIWANIYLTTQNSRLKALAERQLIELGVNL